MRGLKLAHSRYAESLTTPSPFLKGEASPCASGLWFVMSNQRLRNNNRERARFLQFAILPAMMNDAHEHYRNRARAGGHQRPAGAYARGANHVAAHVSCAAASQLSALLLGPARLAHRHLDATNCDELVRIPDHKLKTSARCSVGGRICANDAFIHLGRRDG